MPKRYLTSEINKNKTNDIITYYIPLHPRSTVEITPDVINKLEIRNKDTQLIKDIKYDVGIFIRGGFKLYKYPEHIVPGMLSRTIILSIISFLLVPVNSEILCCIIPIWYIYHWFMLRGAFYDTISASTIYKYISKESFSCDKMTDSQENNINKNE